MNPNVSNSHIHTENARGLATW